jgi:hypothetical protein
MKQKCIYQCTVENNRITAATTAFTGTDDQNQNTIHHLTTAGRTRVQPIDFDYRTILPHSPSQYQHRPETYSQQENCRTGRYVPLVTTIRSQPFR